MFSVVTSSIYCVKIASILHLCIFSVCWWCVFTARASSHSTPSPIIPKQLTPLTPASTRKNKNKHSQPPSTDGHSKQMSVKISQPRDVWIRSPSPAVGPPGHRSRAAGQRTASPAVELLDQRSLVTGQRSNIVDSEGETVMFSRRSSSLSNRQRRTTADQQTSVICCYLIYCKYIIFTLVLVLWSLWVWLEFKEDIQSVNKFF